MHLDAGHNEERKIQDKQYHTQDYQRHHFTNVPISVAL